MDYRLVKLNQLSGRQTSIYTVYLLDEGLTLFEKFFKENDTLYKSELKEIYLRLISIGDTVGAREQYFKLKEGVPGDGVCALYDEINSNLRLYCIRYGLDLIILGGGDINQNLLALFREVQN